MKNTLLSLIIILLGLTACSPQMPKVPNTTVEHNPNSLIINVDKELKSKEGLRGKETLMIDSPLYIGDNDEVSFKGDYLQEESPIKVKIGDNDEVSFTGNQYTIKTMELQNGDIIQMRGKSDNTFVEVEVIR